jgi:hypothetical protein
VGEDEKWSGRKEPRGRVTRAVDAMLWGARRGVGRRLEGSTFGGNTGRNIERVVLRADLGGGGGVQRISIASATRTPSETQMSRRQ